MYFVFIFLIKLLFFEVVLYYFGNSKAGFFFCLFIDSQDYTVQFTSAFPCQLVQLMHQITFGKNWNLKISSYMLYENWSLNRFKKTWSAPIEDKSSRTHLLMPISICVLVGQYDSKLTWNMLDFFCFWGPEKFQLLCWHKLLG